MTIEKIQRNIKSWCQRVLDLLDHTFADFVELRGTFPCEWIDTNFSCAIPRLLFISFKQGRK